LSGRFSQLLLAAAAVMGLVGCGAEPPEPGSRDTAAPVPRDVAKTIDFDSDFYLNDVCQSELVDLPFKRFASYDFIYDSGLPVRVSGSYYEVRGKNAAEAPTIYDEIEATIFRDVEIEVEAEQTAPHFSFDRWDMPFAVSDHPFSEHRQLRHQRAVGATFPFLDLAQFERPDPDRANFSRNFISVLNFLASRGENVWGSGKGFDEREKARELRRATTGTDYERAQVTSGAALDVLKNVPASERLSMAARGNYILVYLGKPAEIIAAVDADDDAVGFIACMKSS
jgi:hypothetical protein